MNFIFRAIESKEENMDDKLKALSFVGLGMVGVVVMGVM